MPKTKVSKGWMTRMTSETVQAVSAGEHVVVFYDYDYEVARTVGSYLAAGVHASGAAVIIATETHRAAFGAELEAAGIDVAAAVEQGSLVSVDAAATMSQFITDGRIDRDDFRRVVGGLVHPAAHGGSVRAYGEMVALLWDAGNVIAAIELEELWNELGCELEFSLLCGYHTSSVSDPQHAEALQQVCHLHSSILHQDQAHAGVEPAEVWCAFPAEAAATQAARRFVADALRECEPDARLLDDAQLVVTELATNAVLHARSPFLVVVRVEQDAVRLTVHDNSRARPRVRRNGNRAMSGGRGLHVIGALTRQWGVEPTDDGKAVWAELER
jgi:anti-sigma regulatory factor (Ser/Thr protein kinase)